jgi:2-methylcitrate dehydratase PrpD
MLGSMCSSLMTAHGAQTGLRAAILAEKGFTSSETALEGPCGYLDVFAEQPDLQALADDLGRRFEISRNTYKPYPCGIVIHPVIDACLELRRTHAMDPADVAAVSVRVSPKALALTDRRHPKDDLGARVSLYHWVAIALTRGTARIQDMDTDSAVLEPTVVRFQEKVETIGDDAIAPDGAEVTVRLQDGRSLVSRVEHRQRIQSHDRQGPGAEVHRLGRRGDRPAPNARRAGDELGRRGPSRRRGPGQGGCMRRRVPATLWRGCLGRPSSPAPLDTK